MDYCEYIQKSIDYIEQHLKDDIDIFTVIRQSGFSTTHFYRIFQALVRESVKEYIRKRRLSEAAVEIITSNRRLIDIAFEFGFNSQEVFTRAFSQMFGITPGRYRERTKKTVLYQKADAHKKMLSNLNLYRYPPTEPQIILYKEFRVIGMKKAVKPGTTEIQNLWTEFDSRIFEIKVSAAPDYLLGLSEYMPDITDESEFTYLACVEADSLDHIPPGMATKRIPCAKYAVFTHSGSLNGLKTTYEYIYGAWLPSSGYELAELDTIESYPNGVNSHDSRFDIYIPVK